MEIYKSNEALINYNTNRNKSLRSPAVKFLGVVIVIMCFVALISINTHASAWFFGEVVKEDGALIRPSTSASSGELGRLPKGSGVKIEKEVVNSSTGNHWYKLYQSDGYIFVDNVKRPSAKDYSSYVQAYIITDNAKIHDGPYGNMNVTKTISNGTLCYLSKEYKHVTNNNIWYRMVNKDTGATVGYIFSDYVRKIKSITAVNKNYVCIKSSDAVVRKAPADSCPIVGSVSPRQLVKVIYKYETENGNIWYKLGANQYVFGEYLKEHTSHTWGTATVTKSPTCTETGTKKVNCTVCNATGTATISALGHNYNKYVCTRCGAWDTSSLKSRSGINNVSYIVITDKAAVHNGPYGGCKTITTLSKGTNITVTEKVVNAEGNTWYKYSGGYIFSSYAKDHSSCKWNSGTVTKAATCTSTGTKKYICTLCGATKTKTIAKNNSHKYEKHVCTRCGAWDTASLKSKSDINNVRYVVISDNAKVHNGPYGSCKTITTLSKKSTIIVTQKITNADGNIWYKYSDGYIFKDYVSEHKTCKWDSGTVAKAATCTSTGTKKYSCTICSATKTEKIAKNNSHKYEKHVCTRCGNWDSTSLKSKANINNVKYVVITDGVAVHNGPYGGCTTIKTLSKGTVITVTQKIVNAEGNTWYKFGDGYIFANYVMSYDLYTATISLDAYSISIYKDATKTLKATVKGPSSKVTWKSSNNSIATVSASGVVTGKKSGTCTITATANGKSAVCTVKVKNPSITLDKSSLKIGINLTKTLKATVKGASSKVTWKSSDTSIATVSSSGKITAKKLGTCTITATANGKSAKCSISVVKHSTKLDNTSVEIYKDTNITLNATVIGKSDKKTWKSSNTSIATVSETGLVTGIKSGSCTITVTANGISANCKVKVLKPTITLDCSSLTIVFGGQSKITATVNGASQTVKWKSINASVATVDQNGVVTAKATQSSTCTITATANGVSAKCTVKIMSTYDKYIEETTEIAKKVPIGQKQETERSGSGLCTYSATTTLLRRKQAYDGKDVTFAFSDVHRASGGTGIVDSDGIWPNSSFLFGNTYTSKDGVSYKMSYKDGHTNTDEMIKYLNEHPEGIMIYSPSYGGYYHAIVITDYEIRKEDGSIQFYADDPVNNKSTGWPDGRVPIENTWHYSKNKNIFGTALRICYLT